MKNVALSSLLKKTIASTLVLSFMTLSVIPLYKPLMVTNQKPEVEKLVNSKESDSKQESRSIRRQQISRGNLNRHEVYLLAMVIEGEAADEPYKGKVAVGAVILNRMESKKFPGTLSGVVYQDLAFESIMNSQYKRPLTRESIKAAQDAVGGHDPTRGALYFWNPVTAKSKWVWSRPVTDQIGRHVFAK